MPAARMSRKLEDRAPAQGGSSDTFEAMSGRRKTARPIRPIAYRLPEAAASLAMSEDHFNRHVRPSVRVVKAGTLTLFPVSELEKWVDDEAQLEIGRRAGS